jgi:multidrug efflux pump subunit AcrA (membrane-fusion protein)
MNATLLKPALARAPIALPDSAGVPIKARLLKSAITLTLVALAFLAAVSLYHRYIRNPWTRDGQVRANIVGIAPRVSGPIIHIAVHDNEEVKERGSAFRDRPSRLSGPGRYCRRRGSECRSKPDPTAAKS